MLRDIDTIYGAFYYKVTWVNVYGFGMSLGNNIGLGCATMVAYVNKFETVSRFGVLPYINTVLWGTGLHVFVGRRVDAYKYPRIERRNGQAIDLWVRRGIYVYYYELRIYGDGSLARYVANATRRVDKCLVTVAIWFPFLACNGHVVGQLRTINGFFKKCVGHVNCNVNRQDHFWQLYLKRELGLCQGFCNVELNVLNCYRREACYGIVNVSWFFARALGRGLRVVRDVVTTNVWMV